jgi:hypothetical protein
MSENTYGYPDQETLDLVEALNEISRWVSTGSSTESTFAKSLLWLIEAKVAEMENDVEVSSEHWVGR